MRGGASSAAAGAVTAAMLASTVATQAFVPVLDRRLGTPRLLGLGLVTLGAPAPLYLLSNRLGWLIAVSVLRGIGFAVLPIARPHGSLASITLLLFGVTAASARWQAGTRGDRMGPRLLLPVALATGATGTTLVAVSLLGGHTQLIWSTPRRHN